VQTSLHPFFPSLGVHDGSNIFPFSPPTLK
jgi:hypothetical protein